MADVIKNIEAELNPKKLDLDSDRSSFTIINSSDDIVSLGISDNNSTPTIFIPIEVNKIITVNKYNDTDSFWIKSIKPTKSLKIIG